MSELPAGIAAAVPPAPRDSASGIVTRRGSDGRREILLGLRSRRSRFMPGHLAFPGGTLDPADGAEQSEAHRRCVAREVAEETGLELPAERWIEAGERITPPMFPVRFRTRFYVASCPETWSPPDPLPSPEEIESLRFASVAELLAEWGSGRVRLPPPVVAILRGIERHEDATPEALAHEIAEANRHEERAPRIEFTPGVWMLPVATATLPPATHTNVWMPGRGRFVILDPGSAEEKENQRLCEVVARRGQSGAVPLAVLLTHGHQDHAAGCFRVARELHVPVRAHPAVLDGLSIPADVRVEPLDDGDELDLEGECLRAFYTPGHAPGHLAYWSPERAILFAGDLISGISTILIDPDGGDMEAYLASLESMDELGARQICPGHGPPLPGRALRKLIEHRLQREARIAEQLSDRAQDLSALARGTYTDVPQMPAALTERQTLAHLILLERRNRARRYDPRGSSWMLAGETARLIETILRERLAPERFELTDESVRHAGHPGATSGGGHYRLVIVSAAFERRTLLERHRMVNDALADLFGERIHALSMTTRAPSERLS